MSREKKEEFIKKFREDKNLSEILRLAKDDDERKAIMAYTESFVSVLYQNVFSHIEKALVEDPEALKKSLQEISDELVKKNGTNA